MTKVKISPKKKVLSIKEKKDGTHVIGDDEYTIDELDFMWLPKGMPVPRVRLKNIRKHVEYFRIIEEEGKEYFVSIDDDDFATIGFGFRDNIRDWWGKIGLYTYVELVDACVELRPEYKDVIEYSSEYIGSADAHFDFAVKIKNEFLDDAFETGLALIEEILKPIRDIERQIDDVITGAKARAKEPK